MYRSINPFVQGLAPEKPTCLAAIFEDPTRLPSASRTSIPSSNSPYRIRTTLQILALAGEKGIQRRLVRHGWLPTWLRPPARAPSHQEFCESRKVESSVLLSDRQKILRPFETQEA